MTDEYKKLLNKDKSETILNINLGSPGLNTTTVKLKVNETTKAWEITCMCRKHVGIDYVLVDCNR